MSGKHVVFPAARAGRLTGRFRRLLNPPEKLFGRYIRPGDTVLDLGCGPGFFSIPMARMVGERGTVIAADVQEEMLALLRAAAEEQDLVQRFRFHKTEGGSLQLDLSPVVSFALAFHVLHETDNLQGILTEIYRITRPGGILLIAEPRFVVGSQEFQRTIDSAIQTGFQVLGSPFILMSRSALMRKAGEKRDADSLQPAPATVRASDQ